MSLKEKVLQEIERKPRRLKELTFRLGDEKKVKTVLSLLMKEGVVKVNNGLYVRVKKTAKLPRKTILCTVSKLAKTFGFVTPVPKNEEEAAKPADRSNDLFIPGRFLMGAMPGDKVMVIKTQSEGSSDEGRVVKIVETNDDLVGTVEKQDGRLVFFPDNCPVMAMNVKKNADGGAKPGEKVAARIIWRGESHRDHKVGIAYRFGPAQSAAACTKSILYANDIWDRFPGRVQGEAKRFDGAKVEAQDMENRTDLRDKVIFTIDGADTKDIDDAISLCKTSSGYELGVHIADVSHYVTQGSALDTEAYERGTSVYTPGSVVPMLPRQLSNGICSLNPGVDRLCLSCIIQLDDNGNLLDYCFQKAVMHSRVKGVYTEVNAIFAGEADNEITQKYAECVQTFDLMRELFEKLSVLRKARGCMEIETGEAKILLDDAGRAVEIKKVDRGIAERMIEEFMLLANTCAAKMGEKLKIPFVYRVHELPDPERVAKLHDALAGMGLDASFEGEVPTQKELSKLLDASRGTKLERAVHLNVLRSMAKAKYMSEPKGHYGLALSDYTHFTSPIRRYPDLIVHRILSAVLSGENQKALEGRFGSYVGAAAVHSSEREVLAMTAERDADDCYKAEYMQDKIGQEFEGVISSVTGFGVYVELENTVEGLIRAASLSEGEMVLLGGVTLSDSLTGRRYSIGDLVKVRLVSVSISAGNVDFELI